MEPREERCNLARAPYRDFSYPRSGRIPKAGGTWVPGVETFRVEELPLYPFCGEGEHVALVVARAGQATRDLAVAVARGLGVPVAAVGYAGMKDRASVAVQAFTVSGVPEGPAAEAFAAEGCTVLSVSRHRNKLRLGHSAGNRFRVLLSEAPVPGVEAAAEHLARFGVPNYYGPQRFGAKGDNAAAGLALLRGRGKVGRWKHDLLVSALQSFLFNEVLARRVEAGTLEVALAGDVLRREDSGGLFLCTEPAADTPRVVRFEVGPTGPMPGRKMVQPGEAVAAGEAAVLRELGLEEALFRREVGSRRPLRVPVGALAVEPAAGGTWLSFTLPAGAFATSVVREVTGVG